MLNVITVNVITCLLLSDYTGPVYYNYYIKTTTYCYHSVNVISFHLLQTDHMKRVPLYLNTLFKSLMLSVEFFTTVHFTINFFVTFTEFVSGCYYAYINLLLVSIYFLNKFKETLSNPQSSSLCFIMSTECKILANCKKKLF
jgi:hypothetical protein